MSSGSIFSDRNRTTAVDGCPSCENSSSIRYFRTRKPNRDYQSSVAGEVAESASVFVQNFSLPHSFVPKQDHLLARDERINYFQIQIVFLTLKSFDQSRKLKTHFLATDRKLVCFGVVILRHPQYEAQSENGDQRISSRAKRPPFSVKHFLETISKRKANR